MKKLVVIGCLMLFACDARPIINTCAVTDDGDCSPEPDNTVYLHIYTSGADGEIFVDGQFVGTSINRGFFNPITVVVDGTLEHVISFGEVEHFITPPDMVIPANFIQAGGGLAFTGAYTAKCYRTFKDVPCEAWYFPYVEELVNQGIADVADNFRPDDTLTRAELVKMLITAIDGLVHYKMPANPTFDDVSVDAWFYDYIEAAVQLGLIAGYIDEQGHVTEKFRPADKVTRAVAMQFIVNSFAVPTTLSPPSPFSDVTPSMWFHDWVLTAYNQSIVDGYVNDTFAPKDPVTRAHVARFIVNAQNPTLRTP